MPFLTQKLSRGEEKINCFIPGEKSHGLGIQLEKQQKKVTCFRRFWVEEPRHSEAFSAEKCCVCRSTRH